MSPSRTKSLRRGVRWLLPAALLAFTPKCLLCVLAYVGLGAALGLGGPEICGASTDMARPWMALLVLGGLSLGITVLYVRHRQRR